MAKIDTFFNTLIEKKGSDLHMEQGQKPKLRVHGRIEEIPGEEVLTEERMISLMKEITHGNDWSEFQAHGDLDFGYSFGEHARFRANYYRHFFGLGCVFRLIPSKILGLDDLSLPKVVKTFGQFRSGLVLVTGPTGSGKSTTLAAIIDYINQTQNYRIITIEEPVEFMHKNKNSTITHREVGEDTPSFSQGLKTALKSDVNVILVGEMRDLETIQLALTAAQMGILVYGTLHTNSAAKTIDRIVDVFPLNHRNQVRSTLSNCLRAVIAQQLLVSTEGNRRYGAYEIMLKSPGTSSIIRSGETMRLTSEIQLNSQAGMLLMDDSLTRLVQEGKITRQEAFMKAQDKSKFIN